MSRIPHSDIKKIARRSLFGIPVLMIVLFTHFLLVDSAQRHAARRIEVMERNGLAVTSGLMDSTFTDYYSALQMAFNADELNDYIAQPSSENTHQAEQLFFRITGNVPSILQLRFLGMDGMELIRVNRESDGIIVVPEGGLQDKSSRYYVQDALTLPRGSVFISELDYNIENGKVVFPYAPEIRLVTPVFAGKDPLGLLVINFDATEFLDFFSSFLSSFPHALGFGLLDSEGRWLIKNDQEDYIFLLEGNELIMDDLPGFADLAFDADYVFAEGKENQYLLTKVELLPTVSQGVAGQTWYLAGYYPHDQLAGIDQNSFLLYSKWLILGYVLLYLLWVVEAARSRFRENDRQMIRVTTHIAEFTYDGVIITDRDYRIIFINRVLEQLTGYKRANVIGQLPTIFSVSNAVPARTAEHQQERFLQDNYLWDVDVSGMFFLSRLYISTVMNGTKRQIEHYIGLYRQPELPEISLDDLLHDRKPDIYRSVDIIPVEVIRERLKEGPVFCVALMVCEKDVLQSYERFRDLTTEHFSDAVSLRYSSEFLLLVFPAEGREAILEELEMLLVSCSDHDAESEWRMYAGCSLTCHTPDDAGEVLQQVRVALTLADRSGAALYRYSKGRHVELLRSSELKQQLPAALEAGELYVLFQPQVRIEDDTVIGAEALIRWQHPGMGSIPPDEFIPILEEDPELMVLLGKFVIGQSVQLLAELKEAGRDPNTFTVSFNLTADDLLDPGITAYMKDQLSRYGVPASVLTVEVTERTLMAELEQMNTIFAGLQQDGIRIAVDDFGTGYSSLNYLKHLNISKIKVDRAFIKDYPDGDDGTIVTAVTSMAATLGIESIVEGVETEAQREFLRGIGCPEYQGYLFSKPVPKEVIVKLLAPGGKNSDS